MRLALELPDTPERLRVRACMAAERILAEHGITLSRLTLLAAEGGRKHKAERAAYQLASDAAVRVLADAGTPAEQIERARFALIP